jgi:hypothetical protein
LLLWKHHKNFVFDMLARFFFYDYLVAVHSTPSCSTFLGLIPKGRPSVSERTERIRGLTAQPEGPLSTVQDLLRLYLFRRNHLSRMCLQLRNRSCLELDPTRNYSLRLMKTLSNHQ